MFRVGVTLLKNLTEKKENVDEHGVCHQLGDFPDGLVFDLEGGGFFQNFSDKGSGENLGAMGFISYKPFNFFSISLSPEYFKRRSDLQYVSDYYYNDENRYLFGEIDQETLSITARINITLTPDFTIQYYGAPFISAALYPNFKKITQLISKSYELDRLNN